jgi:hypothetical protein
MRTCKHPCAMFLLSKPDSDTSYKDLCNKELAMRTFQRQPETTVVGHVTRRSTVFRIGLKEHGARPSFRNSDGALP